MKPIAALMMPGMTMSMPHRRRTNRVAISRRIGVLAAVARAMRWKMAAMEPLITKSPSRLVAIIMAMAVNLPYICAR